MAEKETFQLTPTASEIDAALLVAKNAVTYEPQTVPPEKQAQARANLGLDTIVGGLPKVTLTTIAIADYSSLSVEECAALVEAMKNGVFILECTGLIDGWEFTMRGIPSELREPVDGLFVLYELRFFLGDGDAVVQVMVEGDSEGNFTANVSVEFVGTSAT